ncbi:transcriptional regulator [Zhihengliuella alba]|uniref:Transcriptional regulator n=1 Tax=Zhihengliuella alba TaxID=547018 RepID=A0ABP7CVV5_9MICC
MNGVNAPDRPVPETRTPDAEERTRDRVLQAVLEEGPVSAAELGESLGFTPAAVRRHLDALSKQGLVEVKLIASQGSGAGRPARRYVLSHRGQAKLGNDYLDLATDALTELRSAAGDDAIAAFAARRFQAMEERYRPLVEAAGDDVAARADVLAKALAEDGFVGYTRDVGANLPEAMQSIQLCQGHCPIQGLASAFPDFCEEETKTFARLLGVDVRRLSTLARGGHVCTTHVPVGRHKTPQRAEKRTRIKINKQERLR